MRRDFFSRKLSVFVMGLAFGFALIGGIAWPSSALAQDFGVELVAQIDPFTGDNRYSDVWGEGNYAYVGSRGGSGVMIFDVSVPAAPFLAAHYDTVTGGRFQDVKVQGGIGYFASDNGGGVHIVDVTDPTAPSLLNIITSADGGYDSIHNVFIENGVLYEADSSTPVVKIFDVTNPANPVHAFDLVTTDPSFIHDITVVNNRLYTSGFGGKTDIYDVTGVPASAPVLLGSINSGSNSHSSWTTADGILLASARETSNGDVRIFDISDPGNPILASSITAATLGISGISPHNPVIAGNLLYVSWYQAGLQVIDISNPFSPVHVGSFDTFSGSGGVFDGNWGVYPFLGPDRILLSDLDGGLFVVKLASQPPPPPPPVDADGDGFFADVDCNDNDATIFPGAPEIKHDGIDQDCNNFDLTIDITTAIYSARRKTLEVEATSALGSAAALVVDGFGPMRYKNGAWKLTARKVANSPGAITVTGIEGSESAPVTQ